MTKALGFSCSTASVPFHDILPLSSLHLHVSLIDATIVFLLSSHLHNSSWCNSCLRSCQCSYAQPVILETFQFPHFWIRLSKKVLQLVHSPLISVLSRPFSLVQTGLFDVLHLKHPCATCPLDLIRDALIRPSSNKSGSAVAWES